MAGNTDAQASKPATDRLPKVGDVIVGQKAHGKYKLTVKLGSGGYGEVFEAVNDESKRFAVKVEKFSKSMLSNEANVLKAARSHRCSQILELIEFGRSKPDYYFMIMPLLGKDLSTLRNEQIDQHFSQPTSIRVGILTLRAIQELHSIGFISRDIKPGNFAIGLYPHDRRIYLFDFGLARKYVDSNNNIIQPRKDVGWRGTTRYGSLQAHLKLDLSRKDDVESWFYSLVEFTKGVLPWRRMAKREMVHKSKISVRAENRAAFFENCPKEYDEVLVLIDKLTFPDVPPYEKIRELLEKVMNTNHYKWEQLFDWEDDLNTYSSATTCSIHESDKAEEKDNRTDKTAILPD